MAKADQNHPWMRDLLTQAIGSVERRMVTNLILGGDFTPDEFPRRFTRQRPIGGGATDLVEVDLKTRKLFGSIQATEEWMNDAIIFGADIVAEDVRRSFAFKNALALAKESAESRGQTLSPSEAIAVVRPLFDRPTGGLPPQEDTNGL